MFDEVMREFNFDVVRVADLFDGETPETITDTLRFLAIDDPSRHRRGQSREVQ